MPKFSIKERIASFGFAFNGLKVLVRDEHNAWIHISASCLAITMGTYLGITKIEWISIIICMGLVIGAEIFNTAIEHICNFMQPHQDDRIKNIKDLAAAGVFICALSAFVVGLIIFLPKLTSIFMA